jgi:hypothetical protein
LKPIRIQRHLRAQRCHPGVIFTLGLVPDWYFEINDRITPQNQNNIVEALEQESALFEAIVTLNFMAADVA